MIWFAIAAPVVLIGAFLFWRARKKRREPRLIAFVALRREPVELEPAVLARLAGKAWNADLGDGDAEGADGFVVGAGPMNTIMHEGRMFLVNSFPQPYVENVDEAAAGISDLRIRSLFGEHRAWFSCDAMGVDGTTPAAEVRDQYRRLAALFAELLDDNCLLIFLPDSYRAYPINEDTDAALRSEDPVAALQDSLTVPVVEVPEDDPLMKQAVEDARREWPKFAVAYEAGAGENFTVKAPVSAGGNTEFIWITVTCIEGDLVYGELGNEPADLGDLKLGSKVSVPVATLMDWCYIDPKKGLVGGFSIEAVKKAARRKK
jgi:uncharacterized protein YegJ (DUF2314 family)